MPIDLTLNDDQQLLQHSAHEFFRDRCPSSLVREIEAGDLGYQPEMWQEMADLGWLGMAFPETYGGSGGSFLDYYPLYEEMGRFLVPSPHLDTVAVVGDLIAQAGSEDQKRRFLPAIAEGGCIVSLAILEPSGSFGPRGIAMSAKPDGDNFILDGVKLLVPYASAADYFLCAARIGEASGEGGVTVFLTDAKSPGISIRPLENIAGGPLYEVEFVGVVVASEDVVGRPADGWAALSVSMTKAAVLQTVTIVGAAKAVLEMTNEYAKNRVQFGNPIGKYQAVQYLVTDILFDMHGLELLAKQAAYRIDAGKPFAKEAAMAIAHGKRAVAHVHRQAHEVHAGVGVILVHDLTLFSRRSKFWENNLGDARYHMEQLAVAMGM